jgi:hypothetical protein
MLAFVVRKTSINFEKKQKKTTPKDVPKLKMLEMQTIEKNKRVKILDPEDCYNYSKSEDRGFNLDNLFESKLQTVFPTPMDKLLYNFSDELLVDKVRKKKKFDKRVAQYKNIVKWLDILASIMIIAGCVASQIEGEYYYDENLITRTESIRLIKDLKRFSGNLSMIIIKNYNISYIQDGNYSHNGKKVDFINYENLPVPLKISEFCENLRLVILVLTIICIPLIFLGRYYEFLRDFIYLQKIESK